MAGIALLATVTLGFAVAQASQRGDGRSGEPIHVVTGAGGLVKFNDFDEDGLTIGDRLNTVGPLLNADGGERVGTSYMDCWLGDRVLLDQSPYVCTYVLKFRTGSITTQGLDPHGTSDVLFSVTGGTGAYRGATGHARYVDGETQTDIYIFLDQ
jgi:hypothetical protein